MSSKWAEQLMTGGWTISGRSSDGKLVEMADCPQVHRILWPVSFILTKSRPLEPHPLFVGFLEGGKVDICLDLRDVWHNIC